MHKAKLLKEQIKVHFNQVKKICFLDNVFFLSDSLSDESSKAFST